MILHGMVLHIPVTQKVELRKEDVENVFFTTLEHYVNDHYVRDGKVVHHYDDHPHSGSWMERDVATVTGPENVYVKEGTSVRPAPLDLQIRVAAYRLQQLLKEQTLARHPRT